METFYDISNLLAENAEYNIMLSERAKGKSYQIKKLFINKFMRDGTKFIYLRRHVVELKEAIVNSYFADENIPYRKWTKGKYDGIMCFRGNLYFYTQDGDKNVRGAMCGKYFALSTAVNYKSMSLTEYRNIVFEEFVIEGRYNYTYLPDECDILQQLVSTIARKNKIHVYLVGNTINSMCPYFRYWSLKNIPRQQPGTIDIYNMEYSEGTVKIAVEICSVAVSKGKMFFGRVEQNINNGVWTSKVFPRLPYRYETCTKYYWTVWRWGDICFKAEILRYKKNVFLFVRPVDINKIFNLNKIRYISDEFEEKLSECAWHTAYFYPIMHGDNIIEFLLKTNRVCYSDNLTGEEFQNMVDIYYRNYNNRKGGK